MFVLVYWNRNVDSKRFETRKYYLPESIIKNYNVIINGKNFYGQAVESDVKRHEEIRKLTTGQVQDYTGACLLDYEYTKNNYKLIAVDSSRQTELDADLKAIQHIELVGELKKTKKIDAEDNATDAMDNYKSTFVLTILEKIKNRTLTFSQESVAVL